MPTFVRFLQACRKLTPDSYEQFLKEIKAGLAQNCPVIIPYSTDLDSNGNPQAYQAHWATVIGSYAIPKSKTDYLLLAHYGVYVKVDATKLYKGFALIEDTYPKYFLFKKIKGKNWKKSRTDNFGEVEKSFQMDERDLNEDYKRRLITVKPPGNK